MKGSESLACQVISPPLTNVRHMLALHWFISVRSPTLFES